MRPIFEGIGAKNIVEVGSEDGINTKNILEYCLKNDAHLDAIDPFPNFDVDEFKQKYGHRFDFYKDLSLNRLPLLNDFDGILLDGDHNWFTVYNELKIIEEKFEDNDFPLIFLHDVGWPYARRDLYYNPDNIPPLYRQPYKKLGMLPEETSLQEAGGINNTLYNSIYENTPKNGVLTAVEDFIKESSHEFIFKNIHAFFGLGILYIKNEKTDKIVKKVLSAAPLVDILEEERISMLVADKEQKLKCDEIQRDLYGNVKSLKGELNQSMGRLNKTETRLKIVNNEFEEAKIGLKSLNEELLSLKHNENLAKQLIKQMDTIESSILEKQYYDNSGRSYTQRLISKFPSLYMLLKRDNNSLKKKLINIKGYSAIKKNNLFDIGYYLKNNKDVMKAGKDPFIHYLYHGYKQNRKPNPNFDGDYYLRTNHDVQKLDMNPLIHYSLYGLNEGRRTIDNIQKPNIVKLIDKTDVYDVTKEFISLKPCIIQLTPEKTKNPYYTVIGNELISRGINFKYSNNFDEVEKVLKHNMNCIIHLHQPEPFYHSKTAEETSIKADIFLDGLRKFKSYGAKLIWTMHNPLAHDRTFQKIDEMVNETLFDISDNIIVLGRNAKEILLKQGVKTPISVVIHPSFREHYGPKPDMFEARKELGLPSEAIIFGNIGHIKPYKGLELIIEAFNEFMKSFDDSKQIYLCIAGSSNDDAYIESIKEKSSSNILIINRDLPDSELIKFVSAMDYTIFSFIDIWASSSVVLSLSYGVPAIVPNIGCMSDYIQHLNNGLLYTHDDIKSMVEAFKTAIDLEYYDHLEYMAEAYSEDKTVTNISDEFIKVYTKVLKYDTKLTGDY